MRIWVACLEAVAEMTNYNFGQLYGMPAMEFLTYLAFVNYKRKKEEQELKKINRKYGR